jgi:hypothetical protein
MDAKCWGSKSEGLDPDIERGKCEGMEGCAKEIKWHEGLGMRVS